MGGSSGGGDNYDAEYNRRMAGIYEEQQQWARDYYKTIYKDGGGEALELAQIAKNLENVDQEDLVYKQLLGAEGNNIYNAVKLGDQSYNYMGNTLDSLNSLNGVATSAIKKGFDIPDVNVNERVGMVKADAANNFQDATASQARDMARYGVNANSGRFMGTRTNAGLTQAAQSAAAMTNARVQAENENVSRAQTKAQMGGELLNANAATNMKSVDSTTSGIASTLGLMQNATQASTPTGFLER